MKTKLFLLTAFLTKVLTMSIPQAEEDAIELNGLNERSSSCAELTEHGKCSASCPCPKGECCSKYGFCGPSSKYCDNQMVTTKKATTTKKTTTRKTTSTKKTSTTKSSSTSKSTSTPGMVIYLPNYTLSSTINLLNYDFSDIDVVNYCFFRLDSEGNAYSTYESVDFKLKSIINLNTVVKEKYPHLRTILSIGGATGSKDFNIILSSDSRIVTAAKSIANAMEEYLFDGIDIDWEFPKTDSERESLVTLLKKIRYYIGNDKLLTLSSSATASNYNGYISKYEPYLDWFNLMTYNYAGSWSKVTGHNAPLYDIPGDINKQTSVHHTVTDYQNAGVPNHKLVIGGAFNGKVWKVNSSTNNGYNQSGHYEDIWTYKKLRTENILSSAKKAVSPWVRTWHSDAKSPTLFNPNTKMYISYDDTEAMCERAAYAKKNKLGGFMVWEVGQDYDGELIGSSTYCYKKY